MFIIIIFHKLIILHLHLGTDHLTCRGGYGFLFHSENVFLTTRELEYLFFLSREARIFFQNITLGYMTKTLNQIIFLSSTKIRIFVSATMGIQIFKKKKKNITRPAS